MVEHIYRGLDLGLGFGLTCTRTRGTDMATRGQHVSANAELAGEVVADMMDTLTSTVVRLGNQRFQ